MCVESLCGKQSRRDQHGGVYLSIDHPSIHLCIHLSINLFIYLSIKVASRKQLHVNVYGSAGAMGDFLGGGGEGV